MCRVLTSTGSSRVGRVSPEQVLGGRARRAPAVELLGELGWETVNAFEETLGPGGTLGRDSHARLCSASAAPGAARAESRCAGRRARGGGRSACARPSVMDPTRANREVYDLLRDGYLAAWRDDTARSRPRGSPTSTGATPRATTGSRRTRCGSSGLLHAPRRPRLFVNGIPLVLFEFKGRPVGRAAYDDNLRDYRDTIPQLFVAERVRDPLERLGDAGRRDVRAVGALRRVEADRRRGTRGRVELETAIRGMCEPARLLDSSRTSSPTERPGGLVKVLAQNHQVLGVNAAMEALERIRARARSGSASSGTPRAPARACRCCCSPRRCCAASRRLDVRDGHRPQGARRPAPRRVRRRRRGQPRGGRPRRHAAHLRELLARRPPLRLHADPQVPAARGRGARCRCSRIATTSS